MALSKTRWKPFAESKIPHEREALEFLGQGLPDSDPTLLYTNFEFIADDGSVNEIDALASHAPASFLVEVKGRGGVVSGNRHNWDWEKDGHTLSIDSPLILANAKARKLADLIGKQRSFRNERRPWIEPLVFLQLQESACDSLNRSACASAKGSLATRPLESFQPFFNATTLAASPHTESPSTVQRPNGWLRLSMMPAYVRRNGNVASETTSSST